MLTGIVAVISFAGSSESSARPTTAQTTMAATVTREQDYSVLQTGLTQTQHAAPKFSVSFNDENTATYVLSKGVPTEKISRRPDIDVWYGLYSEQDYPILRASPFEKEPSRLNVKISFAF